MSNEDNHADLPSLGPYDESKLEDGIESLETGASEEEVIRRRVEALGARIVSPSEARLSGVKLATAYLRNLLARNRRKLNE
jgi:hypothetical protein